MWHDDICHLGASVINMCMKIQRSELKLSRGEVSSTGSLYSKFESVCVYIDIIVRAISLSGGC